MQIDLGAIFASAPSPYVLIDRDLRIVWANDAYLKVTGRTNGTLIGRLLTEEFPAPDDSVSDKMLRGSFRKVLATGQIDHMPLIPYPIIAADGQMTERFWSATHTPVLDAQGDVQFILQNSMDVTDVYLSDKATSPADLPQRMGMAQRAEAVATENLALASLTDFFQSAFDQAPSFMAIMNGPEHVFQIANQAYTDLIGRRNVIGLPVREALPDIEGQGFYEMLDTVYTTGQPISLKGKLVLFKATPDGPVEQRFVDFIFHPLKGANGQPNGIFVQGHDVTGQKLAESSLTATREKFRTMAQGLPNHVWTAKPDGSLTWLNDRIYDFTGLAPGDLYGTDWSRVVHPDDLPSAAANWARALDQGVEYEAEFRIRKADGSFRWHLVRASPLRADDGAVMGWVGTNTDIETRKTWEAEIAKLNTTLETRVEQRNRELEDLHATLRQSQKMEAIGNLAGGIAHDFNNLLQVITGNLQLAKREMAVGSPGQARLDQAMTSVQRGATLASQLLSFARKQPLVPMVINLENQLGNITEILGSAIGEGVELDVRCGDGLWNTSVDPTNLENALLNLAINARDAMEGQGHLTITVDNVDLDRAYAIAHPDARPGPHVVISVADTGCGMKPETLEHIFEPFFTTKAEGHGTGLGLSMVYGFARQSGGHIALDSVVGSGTTVRIYLPQSTEPVQDAPAPGAADLSGGHETILLVEDDEDVRDIAVSMLSDLGYTVLQAGDAAQALKWLETGQTIDLLFTDMVMPGALNGKDLAERAQQIIPDLPVLFTSGYVQDSIVHEGRLDEGVQLLGKPYTQSEMAQKIRGILGGRGRPAHPAPSSATADTPPADMAPRPASAGVLDTGRRILVCEDDPLIRTDMTEGLRAAGYEVVEAGSANAAMEVLKTDRIALLITDVGLPDRSGEDLAQDARGLCPDLPVIFATGGVDVPAAGVLGNCSVLGKPFRDVELLEAVGAMTPA
ncbi:PAS domain-containing protein [Rhodobacteraceae bacterium KMM 6894]|nr:PAS domain-containing protein [Rhodobacteraceae bacterium KMM 6894]